MASLEVYKVAFNDKAAKTSKLVIFKKPRIADTELAMRLVGEEKNQFIFQFKVNLELLKICLLEIGGQKLDKTQGLDLEELLTDPEISALLDTLSKVKGGGEIEVGEISAISYGEK